MNFKKETFIKFKDASLSVQKKNIRFLELLFKYHGTEFLHDRVIEILYNYREPLDLNEIVLKYYYLSYEFIINSFRNDVDTTYIKRIYYMLKCKELSEEIALSIQSFYYTPTKDSHIEKAIKFHYQIYETFCFEDSLFKTTISLMFLIRELLKVNLCTFRMIGEQYSEYLNARTEYFEKKDILPTFLLLERIYDEERVQPKDYLQNATILSITDIKSALLSIEDLLNNYGINMVSIFGSFSKNKQRINSDVDLYINVIEDVSYNEKIERIEKVKDILFSKLKRYVDIQELGYPILNSLIKETRSGILLYKKGEENEQRD